MTPLKKYILNGSLAEGVLEARKIQTSATQYIIVKGELYRTMGDWPLLKCIFQAEGLYVLKKFHPSICGAHIGQMH